MLTPLSDKLVKSINRSAEISNNYNFSYDIFNDLEESFKSMDRIQRADINSQDEHADFILFNACILSIVHYLREKGVFNDVCQYLKSLC